MLLSLVVTSDGSYTGAMAAADLNGDGKLDLAAVNTAPANVNEVLVLLGNGDGTFQPGVNYAVGLGPNAIVTAISTATGSSTWPCLPRAAA